MNRWVAREAARVGNNRALETATNDAVQKRAREIRAENLRRTAAAS